MRLFGARRLVDKIENDSNDVEGFRFILRRRADGSCTFHDRDSGCTVYESRPLVCRAFPGPNHVICPNRGMLPTSEMVRARAIGDHESFCMAVWGPAYYPAKLISAWIRKRRSQAPFLGSRAA